LALGRRLAVSVCAFVLGSILPNTLAGDEVFVSNYYGASITIYPRTATGDVAPSRVISTGLILPHDIAIDLLHRELFVPNNLPSEQGPAVNVYDLEAGLPGNGDDPKRTIMGPATQLERPAGLLVDSVHQELYVANDLDPGSAILVYALTASGNAAPIRVLQGPLTTLQGPISMALDLVHGELIIVNYKSSDEGSITVFPRTAQGNVAPIRTIQGPNTQFNRPQALALDLAHDELILANSFFDNPVSRGGLLVFSRTASGDVAPIRQITGTNTQLCNPIGMTFDRVNDELLVTNAASNPACVASVTVYPRGASGNIAPLRTIGPGPASQLTNPEGIAVTTTVECSDPLIADGTPCDDGNACTSVDACSGGVCTGGSSVCGCANNAACVDTNPCTDDICVNPGAPSSTCAHTNNTAACDDENSCTTGDVCGGAVCAGTPVGAPAETHTVTAGADKATYSWAVVSDATRYDVVRGRIGALPVGPTDDDEDCFPNLSEASLMDASVPDPDDGFWYLSRGDNNCAEGSYGRQSDGTLRSTATCP